VLEKVSFSLYCGNAIHSVPKNVNFHADSNTAIKNTFTVLDWVNLRGDTYTKFA
jgi:hypothetical protein